MQIAGLQKSSLVDYPGKIAITVFTPKCNFDCFYCHNRDLLGKNYNKLEENEVLKFIKSRQGLIDAVVISGGEPTLQKDLIDFIKKVKKLGFLIKLDTNGYNPNIVENIIKENIVNYYAVDYKAPKSKYVEICSKTSDNTLKTIELLKKNNCSFEVRTTVAPTLTIKDFKKIKEEIGNVKYVLNKYNIPLKYKEKDMNRILQKPVDIEKIKENMY